MHILPEEMLLHVSSFLDDSELGRFSQTNHFFRNLTLISRRQRLVNKTAAEILSWLFDTKCDNPEIDYYFHPIFKNANEVNGAFESTDIICYYLPELFKRYQEQFFILSQNLMQEENDTPFAHMTKAIIAHMRAQKIDINKKGFDNYTIGHILFLTKDPQAISQALLAGIDLATLSYAGESAFAGFVDFIGFTSLDNIIMPNPELIEICLLHCKKSNIQIPFHHADSMSDPLSYTFYYEDCVAEDFSNFTDPKLDMFIKTIAVFQAYLQFEQDQKNLELQERFEEIAKASNKCELFLITKSEFYLKLHNLTYNVNENNLRYKS